MARARGLNLSGKRKRVIIFTRWPRLSWPQFTVNGKRSEEFRNPDRLFCSANIISRPSHILSREDILFAEGDARGGPINEDEHPVSTSVSPFKSVGFNLYWRSGILGGHRDRHCCSRASFRPTTCSCIKTSVQLPSRYPGQTPHVSIGPFNGVPSLHFLCRVGECNDGR